MRKNLVLKVTVFLCMLGIGYGLFADNHTPSSNQFEIGTKSPVIETNVLSESALSLDVVQNTDVSIELSTPRLWTLPRPYIDNIDCKLISGKSDARGIAILVVPRGEGAEFVITDASGTRNSGLLPFIPNWVRLGQKADGSIISGFASQRFSSEIFRLPDSSEPLLIFRNRHVIFESDRVWDFDIATDGSSFAVHEPADSNTSRLIIRNLDEEKESHYDLGESFTPMSEFDVPYALKYSIDQTEVMFEPGHGDARGKGKHWFFPVARGKPRRVTVVDGQAAVFSDSSNMYFADYGTTSVSDDRDRSWIVSRKELNLSNGESTVIWERNLNLEYFSGTFKLSPNGRWLALSSWDFTVLSTETGETKLEFSVVGRESFDQQRFKEVLPEDATFRHVGAFIGSGFDGDFLLLRRKIGSTKACSNFSSRGYRECLRENRLRGRYRQYEDVFDMNQSKIDSRPTFRREVYRDTSCSKANSSLGGLLDDNGELSYIGPTKIPVRLQ